MNISHRFATHAIALGIAALGCSAAMAQNGVPNNSAPPGAALPNSAGSPDQSGAPNAAGPSGATPGATDQTAPHYSHRMTQDFITQAAYANQAEIADARYALAHTSSEHVKAFARQMIHDHTMAGDQLKQIADSEGFTAPTGLSTHDRIAMSRLERDHGAHFNAAYSEAQARDHRQVVAMFRRAEQNARIAPAVRDFARMTLPTLMDHLRMANQLVATEAGGNRSAG